jgi:hypothetical protein
VPDKKEPSPKKDRKRRTEDSDEDKDHAEKKPEKGKGRGGSRAMKTMKDFKDKEKPKPEPEKTLEPVTEAAPAIPPLEDPDLKAKIEKLEKAANNNAGRVLKAIKELNESKEEIVMHTNRITEAEEKIKAL